MLAELAAENSAIITCGRPPLALVFAWYAALATALLIPLKLFHLFAVATAFAAACIIAVVVWQPLLNSHTTTITVAAPRSALAPIVLLRGPNGNLLINTGARFHGHAVAQWMRLKGIRQLDAVILPVDKASWTGGFDRISQTIPIASLYAQPNSAESIDELRRLSWYTGATLHPLTEQPTFLRGGSLSFNPDSKRPIPIIQLPSGFGGSITIFSHKSTGWKVDLIDPDGKTHTITAPPNAPAIEKTQSW